MQGEWDELWEQRYGGQPGEAPSADGAGDVVERLPRAAGPGVGEEFSSGVQPTGFTWRVEGRTGDGCVVLRLHRDGEATASILRWPINRWQALVEKEQLAPAVRA